MGMLKDKEKKKVEKLFKGLENDVKLIMFTQEMECQYCEATRTLLEDLAGLSDKVSLEVRDFVTDKKIADKYGVDKIPATIVMDGKDYGIRFYGVPAGYEFTTLIEDILMVGKRDHGLKEDVLQDIDKVDKPVHIQVLISPT